MAQNSLNTLHRRDFRRINRQTSIPAATNRPATPSIPARQVMNMRDMTMVTNTPTVKDANQVRLVPLSVEQELASRYKLVQAMQMTLEPREVLRAFFKQLQTLVAVSGLAFRFENETEEFLCGRSCLHHCDYRLNTDDGYLGEIIFNRSKRFSEEELTQLETLLGTLVFPLRNAIRYQNALRMALLDPLTLLGNRNALDTALRRELQLAERHHHELSLLMIDVDHFKAINDQYGHSVGDQVLRSIAQTIQAVCRGSDVTFRFGGEEFVVVLGKTPTSGAAIIADRIRQAIAEQAISTNVGAVNSTVSIGIATRHQDQTEHIDDLFERADKALYAAKAAGRNCIVTSTTQIA